MSLDKNGVVPVDTHVLQIAHKYLKAGVKPTEKPSEGSVISTAADDKPQKGKRRSKTLISKEESRETENGVDLASVMASSKTLTPRIYDAIGDYFRSIWGADFAGWAQSVVFAADLKTFAKDGKGKEATTQPVEEKDIPNAKKKKKRSC